MTLLTDESPPTGIWPAPVAAERDGGSARGPGVDAMAGVRVSAPARLHLGFLDPAGTLGRRFGSLGVVIDGFDTVVEAWPARSDDFTAVPASQHALRRVALHVDVLRAHTGCRTPLRLHLARTAPAHAGFGSGTQLALAVGRAFCEITGKALRTGVIAGLTGRGIRSGVGIAGFDAGGLLLDGGPSRDGAPASVLSRIAMPPAWRIVLALDLARQGLSGDDERRALAGLPPMAQASAAQICHEVLMRTLPGAADDDFQSFAAGVSSIQRLVGAHFSPAQEAGAFASPAVARLIEGIGSYSSSGTGPALSAGIGQSSWGPTGFAFLPSHDAAQAAIAAARASGLVDAALALHVVAPRNHGATIATMPPLSSL